MKQLTIKQIEQRLVNIGEDGDAFIAEIRNDHRKGVQKLIAQWERRQANKQALKDHFERMRKHETNLRQQGHKYIAGIDEVGRGPLAGPVVAAAVILPNDFELLGLNDSKALSEKKREQYFNYIKEHAIDIGIGIIEANEIDQINIYEATKKAMCASVVKLHTRPDYLLVDAMELPTNIDQLSLVKGDANSISIAAASIIAKVTRDRIMKKLANTYPVYKFETNMGYGTKEHLQAIEKHGITPYHRTSFSPIREYE